MAADSDGEDEQSDAPEAAYEEEEEDDDDEDDAEGDDDDDDEDFEFGAKKAKKATTAKRPTIKIKGLKSFGRLSNALKSRLTPSIDGQPRDQ